MADESNKHGTKNKQNKRRLFEDISVVQVTATALAAVTSMLLSSYIGIAGSVIGVAVASIVSTTAASLYKHFLKESTEKIKEIPVIDKTHDLIEHMTSTIGMDKHDERDDDNNALADDGKFANEQPSDNTITASNTDSSAELPEHQDESPDSIPLDELSIQANAVTLPISELEGDTDSVNSLSTEDTLSDDANKTVDADRTDDATESAKYIHAKIKEDDPRIKAALIAKRRMKIGLIVVCVVSALIAVALSAVVVYVSSQGQGIGAKPQSIFVPLTTSESSKGSASDPLDLFEGDHSSSSSSSASSSDSSSSTNSASSSSNSSAESSSSSAEDSSSTNTSTDTSTTTPDSSSPDASSSSSSEDNAQDPTTT